MTQQHQVAAVAAQDASSDQGILYHITHDVRACLRAIKTIPQWVQDDLLAEGVELPAATQELFDMLSVQVNRADRLLVDLRDYDRIGRKSDPNSVHDLGQIVEAAIQEARVSSAFQVVSEVDGFQVFGPRNDLVKVFAALLSNAMMHHDRGTGLIRLVTKPVASGLKVRVRDDGPGIPSQFHDRVFDLLTTLKSRDECDSSGVGLALSRRVMTQIGGTIRILNLPDRKGTTLEMFFPHHAE